jgi:acetyl-CoA acetyltransferase
MATQLGIPDIGFAASVTGGGGGSAGSLGLGAAAIVSGQADVVVSLVTLQQTAHRLGGTSSGPREVPVGRGGEGGGEAGVSPDLAFTGPAGIIAPGHNFAMIANRHMYEYGTTREHFAEICIAQRDNAIRRPTSLMRTARRR